MSKPKRERSLADNEAKAIGRSVRTSQYKLNRVVESIRGNRVEQALAELTFSPKRIAGEVIKVLRSAIANAENNQNLDIDDLIVREQPKEDKKAKGKGKRGKSAAAKKEAA